MNRSSGRTLAAILTVLLAVLSGMAVATPVFSINTQQDWLDAYNDGRIQPVLDTEFQGMVLDEPAWPLAYQEAVFVTPRLYVIQGEYENEPGLVMAWGPDPELPPPTEPTRFAAAWDYVYPLDPNLNGTRIEFSIFPPVYSTMFSLNLIDGNGNYREWIWHAGDPGEVPAGVWSDLLIDPVTGWTNWPTIALFTHDSGVGFDLSSIQYLRFNENILWDPNNPFQPPPSVFDPSGQGIPPGWLWNAWDHVAVEAVPEPATMLLLGGGLLALARRRRRRK